MACRIEVALLAVLALPGVVACTTSAGPFHDIRFVAMEGNQTLVDIPTTIRVGPNDLCGSDEAPHLTFDGRYAAWPAWPGGLHAVDVLTGQEWTFAPGALTQGHVASVPADGASNVTLIDLASGSSRRVEARPGQPFIASLPGAVVAVDMSASNLSVLDPVTGAWRLQDASVPGAGYLKVLAGDADWIVLQRQQVLAVEVATGRVTTLTVGSSHVVGITGDRVYLADARSVSGSPAGSSPLLWSMQLPLGANRTAGAWPQPGMVAGRSVGFVESDTSTAGHATPAITTGAWARADAQAGLPGTEGNTRPGTSPTALAVTGVGLLGVLGLTTMAVLLRRRLE